MDDLNIFGSMVDGTVKIVDKATKPWKWAVVCLVIAVTVCIIGWVTSTFVLNNTINRHMDTIDRLTDHIIAIERAE